LLFIRLIEEKYNELFGNKNPSDIEIVGLIDFEGIKEKIRSFGNPRYSSEQKQKELVAFFKNALILIEKEHNRQIKELEHDLRVLKETNQI